MYRHNIQTNIKELFTRNNRFIVPLYQRNFAWGSTEITQLQQDIYESFKINRESSYFVGSIVYISRANGDYEIIDGQQRLTVIALAVKLFDFIHWNRCKLDYDSRDQMSEFLSNFYEKFDGQNESSLLDNTNGDLGKEKLINAIDCILSCELDLDDENLHLKAYLRTEEGRSFVDYFFNNVIFVLAEMPQDTDVATYFEIMNNSGEQLQKHEIVKSQMMGSVDMTEVQMENFTHVWDACSHMGVRIEKSFNRSERNLLFGDIYQELHAENIWSIVNESIDEKDGESIEEIIDNKKYNITEGNEKSIDDDDNTENKGDSLIDFPNFLMIVFRLLYNKQYKERMNNNDIPLNEKDLLKVYNRVKDIIDPDEFIQKLLFYRLILDHYIIRSDEDDENNRWELKTPKRVEYREKIKLQEENTFKSAHQDKIIKALSMLQVSYPSRKNKRYLYHILSWFKEGKMSIDGDWYLQKLNKLILSFFNSYKEDENLYCLGTSTPRFILNFIDYLYYCSDDKHQKFDFRYNNSVEHHLPQSCESYTTYGRDVIDSIGNLCLISKRLNSSLNDNDPISKVNKTLARSQRLSPKRSIMYERTKKNKKWDDKDIKKHRDEVVALIGRRLEILSFDKLEMNNLTCRAMIATGYKGTQTGYCYGWPKYNFCVSSGKEFKDAYNTVLEWQKVNPLKSLEDFIVERVEMKDNGLKEWQIIFATDSSVTNYCLSRNFSRQLHDSVTLLRGNRFGPYAARDLGIHLLYQKLKHDMKIYPCDIDAEGLNMNLSSLPLFQKSTEQGSKVMLSIWVDQESQNWCYALNSGRNANALENRHLVEQGWEKGKYGYYISKQPYLCTNDNSFMRISVQNAYKSIKFILNKLTEKYTS